MAEKIISRADAIAQGLNFYFTGKPCEYGHVAERRVNKCTCIECERRRGRQRLDDPVYRASRMEYFKEYQRQFRKENHDRLAAEARAKYQADPEKAREDKRWHRLLKPKLHKAVLRRSYLKHKAKRNEEAKAWKAANREAWAALQKSAKATRRAREKAAPGKVTKADILALYHTQNGLCVGINCRTDLSKGYHLDHIAPLSRGGPNTPENSQLLCPPCNMEKQDKTMAEWRAYKLLKSQLLASNTK